MIAAPIESYLGLLDQQFFKNWRAGGDKARALDAFLLMLRVIDKSENLQLEDKIEGAYKALEMIKKDEAVYTEGGKTALAVDRANQVINLVKEDSVMQLALIKI
ncbi:MAG: hypothetical protein ACRCXC_02810 [Legionella sp.]